MAKSKFKKEFHPTQHKGRRIPLHLTEKVERELKKLIDEKQIKKTNKMLGRTLHKSSSHHTKIRSINQNCTRLQDIKRCNTQK